MVSIIALITLIALIIRTRLNGESWLVAVLAGIKRYLMGLISIAGLLFMLVLGIGITRAILHPVAEAAIALFPEGPPATSHARREPAWSPPGISEVATLPRLTPTPQAEVALLPQGYAMDIPSSLPVPTVEAPPRTAAPTLPASLPTRTPSRSMAAPTPTPVPARDGCDPAYPDAETCLPPGPPFDQGCAITDARRFTVLPPDPQGLDHDHDGIGCEPIA